LRDRDEELFRLFYFALIAHFSPLLSVSRKKRAGCLFHPKSIPVFQSKSIPFKINLQTCFVSIAILAVPPK
jgi:hypothetical protein